MIVAGAPRSRAVSLSAALDILGYQTYDIKSVLVDDHSSAWRAVYEDGNVDHVLQDMLELGYEATVDFPCSLFTLDLAKRFPEAKVVLSTQRDPTKWLASVQEFSGFHDLFQYKPLAFIGRLGALYRMLNDAWDQFGCPVKCDAGKGNGPTSPENIDSVDEEDVGGAEYRRIKRCEDDCITAYQNHTARIREGVPAARLLELDTSEGWGPLCKFLGVPVPDVRFPDHRDYYDIRAMTLVLMSSIGLFWSVPCLISLFVLRWFVRIVRQHSRHGYKRPPRPIVGGVTCLEAATQAVMGTSGHPGGHVKKTD